MAVSKFVALTVFVLVIGITITLFGLTLFMKVAPEKDDREVTDDAISISSELRVVNGKKMLVLWYTGVKNSKNLKISGSGAEPPALDASNIKVLFITEDEVEVERQMGDGEVGTWVRKMVEVPENTNRYEVRYEDGDVSYKIMSSRMLNDSSFK